MVVEEGLFKAKAVKEVDAERDRATPERRRRPETPIKVLRRCMAQEWDAMQETEREAAARQDRDTVYRDSKKSEQKNRENRIFSIE